jgi:hypothetical protein
MARKAAATLLFGVWIALFAIEVAYQFSFINGSNVENWFNGTPFGFGAAIEASENDDSSRSSPLAGLSDGCFLSIKDVSQFRLKERERLFKKASEIYKLQHAFLL